MAGCDEFDLDIGTAMLLLGEASIFTFEGTRLSIVRVVSSGMFLVGNPLIIPVGNPVGNPVGKPGGNPGGEPVAKALAVPVVNPCPSTVLSSS